MKSWKVIVATAAAAGALLVATIGTASAQSAFDSGSASISASPWAATFQSVLQSHPDAVQVSPAEIVFDGGHAHLYGSVTPFTISTCTAKGSVFCFFDNSGYGGAILATFSGNGWWDSSGIGSVGSEYNNWSHSAFVHKSSQSPPEVCDPPGSGDSIAPYAHPQWLYLAGSQNTC